MTNSGRSERERAGALIGTCGGAAFLPLNLLLNVKSEREIKVTEERINIG